MPPGALPQLVYIVRLWPATPPEQPAWRVSVQQPETGERHIFADLEEFFAFVEEQTRSTPVLPVDVSQ